MVGFAFIFLAVLLLSPMLLVTTWDLFARWLAPDPRVRRGFEVIHPTEKR
jgi:hypothetical protein